MSKSKELSEFDRGSIVRCHLCGKSVREIADILQKPKSTVSDVIVKWKRRGSETAEKRTGRQKILGERSRRTLKRVVKQNHKSTLVETLRNSKVNQELVLAELKTWDSMVVQPLTSQPSLHRMRSINCNGVEFIVIGLWKTVLWSDESRLQSGSRMGLADARGTFF
ncbi:uncharacterized protein TNCV_4452121 [Trichonephila clavipes]|nr:uncharacterized protein TNCV_4452121 [Trichonephila clavipes]